MSETQETNTPSTSKPEINEDEEVVQLGDVIKQQDDMMEEVAAVLGAGDDYNCSYTQGYMSRQALYACLTCVPQGKEDFTKAAGFCLACSYHCHDGHNLIELYTKRRFRCDCGNLKFGDVQCNLHTNKEDFNNENVYNQNFSGLYCICHKPYPDPDDHIEDDMIQCIICEDWYHSRHLNTTLVDDFDEMLCETCMKEHSFLMAYSGLAVTKIEPVKVDQQVNVTTVAESDETKNVDENIQKSGNVPSIAHSGSQGDEKMEVDMVDTPKDEKEKTTENNLEETKDETKQETNEAQPGANVEDKQPETIEGKETKVDDKQPETKEDNQPKETNEDNQQETKVVGTSESREETDQLELKQSENSTEVTPKGDTADISKQNGDASSEKPESPKENGTSQENTEISETKSPKSENCSKPVLKDPQQPRTLFMKELTWRQSLCKCETCMNLYKEHKLTYLLDPEDTVQFYEAKGKEKFQDAKQQAIEAEQQMLKNLPRAPLLNAMAGFNDFKEQLAEYLKQFAEQKKVLTVDDINVFFSKLNANKRQKTSETTYFCR